MVQNSSSFIPNNRNGGATPSRVKRRRTFNIFSFIGSTLLVASLLLAGGVYFYKKNAEEDRAHEIRTLQSLKGKISDEKINEIRRFDKQLRAASFLMENHVAPTLLFTSLETHTKKAIQFIDFEFAYDPGFEAEVKLKGGTDDFKTIALQASEFKADKLFDKAVFTDLSTVGEVKDATSQSKATKLERKYKIGFSVENHLSHDAIKYTATQRTNSQDDASLLTGDGNASSSATTTESIQGTDSTDSAQSPSQTPPPTQRSIPQGSGIQGSASF